MPLTRTTFNPQIDYGGESPFVFSTYGMSMVSIPDESYSLRWDTASIPNRDGADAYGGELDPLQLNLRFEMNSFDPDTVHSRLELLKTALRGKTSAAEDWPEGHFKFYLYNSESAVLYLDRCICQSLRIANASHRYFRGQGIYTLIEITIQANNPAWQTTGEPTTAEFEAPLIINVPVGASAALVINLVGGAPCLKVYDNGSIRTTGELHEQLESIP